MPWTMRIAHWFGRCLRCRVYETDEGIGGKCIDCGKVHGWVTREELCSFAAEALRSDLAALRGDWDAVLKDSLYVPPQRTKG